MNLRRWAAIASYLPERTDNDIKNYWNTHLRKKLKKINQTGDDNEIEENSIPQVKGQWERRLQTDIHMAKQALCEALSLDKPTPILAENQTSPYASNTENIARLLEKWMKKPENSDEMTNSGSSYMLVTGSSSSEGGQDTIACKQKDQAFDSLLSFNSLNSDCSQSVLVEEKNYLSMDSCFFQNESKPNQETQVPLMFMENWPFNDEAAQCNEDLMNVSLEENTAGLF